MAVVGWVIAGWIGRGCRRASSDSRRSPNRNARGNAGTNARSDDGSTAINCAAAIGRRAVGGAAIRATRCSAAIRTANGRRARGGANGSAAHRAAIRGSAARSRHRAPAESFGRRRQGQHSTDAEDGQAFHRLCLLHWAAFPLYPNGSVQSTIITILGESMPGRMKIILIMLTNAGLALATPIAAQAPEPMTTAFDGKYTGVSADVSKY